MAISHHHSDHYGGMDQVVRAMKPRYFLASRSGHTTSMYLKLLKTVEAEGITVIEPTSRARKIELGSIELTIFPQPPEDKKEENNNSIGLRLKYGNFSMLLTGDSEEKERQWWLKSHSELVSECTILKLPHHGSRNGTDARWLRIVRPELAVASLGKNNDYGHPHSETISLLRRTGLPLLRTDQVGTITITTDGRSWEVVEPTLANRGHPTQADIDRVAAGGENDQRVVRPHDSQPNATPDCRRQVVCIRPPGAEARAAADATRPMQANDPSATSNPPINCSRASPG